MKSIYYNCLFSNNVLTEPNDKIVYSYLIYRSFLYIDAFGEDGFDYENVEEYLNFSNEISYLEFSYSKAAKDLNMSLNTVKSRIKSLCSLGLIEWDGEYMSVFITDEIRESFFFELCINTELKGETLIVYSYLKHKSKKVNGIISTYDIVQAKELSISKKHYQKILCGLYDKGLAERLPNGRLKIN